MRHRIVEIQQESVMKAQQIKDDVVKNEARLTKDNETLTALKLVLTFNIYFYCCNLL